MKSRVRTSLVVTLSVAVTAAMASSGASGAGTCSSSTPQYCPTPIVTTGAATSPGTNSATLNGTVNPNGVATVCRFQYGRTTSYGMLTAIKSVGAGTSAVPVSAPISGLTTGTTYHFRLICANAGVTGIGGDRMFTTSTTPTGTCTGVTIKTRVVSVKKKSGKVGIRIASRGSGTCKGKLTLKSTHGKKLANARSFSIPGGTSRVITLKLTKKALKKLKKHHPMKARAKATTSNNKHASRVVKLKL